ncbi:von Willebrand factor A domain-containing protein 8 [Saguinus oedipus]|uniref:von Willebrand factor A domain-containing protein 8 n=1 Tax=Saguinus oedipus TaxID=9490 RepID=A0ABQ9VTS7_SAGOE|nr:von Willebrand factor A domain-containing protein 8 [Saguinus oedipus]
MKLEPDIARITLKSIFPIHPSFRIIALAEPPVIGSPTHQWLGPEFLTMFFFHYVKPLVKSEEIQVIKEMTQSLAASLSTRQLLRISRRLSQYPDENLHSAVTKACLSR